MPALGAVVLGIGAYPPSAAGEGIPALQFPAKDAEAFAAYLRACWPEPDMVLRLLPEAGGTGLALRRAFDEIAARGRFDLFVVYLSGHGVASPETTGFLAQPEPGAGAPQVVAAAELDRLLRAVDARRTIFILDCCFAEAVVRGMPFFTELDDSEARLFIASSRANQFTWEDERAGHGVFTAHMLDLLNTGSAARLGGVRDQVLVDAELFPFLCEQVPLYVLEHKGARQEPVKGGVSTGEVTLPVARAARRLQDRSTLGTALRRVRQILVGIGGASVVGIALVYTLLWYPQLDRNGEIVLLHGAAWLEPILRYAPSGRVHTGLRLEDLSPDPAMRQAIQSGSLTGVWTHVSRDGHRSWYDRLRPGLDPAAAQRADALAGLSPAGRPRGNPDSPSEVARAAWSRLSEPDAATLAWVLQAIPGADRRSPLVTRFDPNLVDFTIDDRTARQMQDYAAALRAAAMVDPDRTLPVYLGFLKATQEWLGQNTDAQRGGGSHEAVAEATASVLPVIASARRDRGLAPVDPATATALTALAANGYFETAGRALAQVNGAAPPAGDVARIALARFQGDPFDEGQLQALRVLTGTLDGSADGKALTTGVLASFDRAGRSEDSFRTKFLIDAADRRALPPAVISELLAGARAALRRPDPDFMDQERARILAHGMRDIPAPDRPTVYALIARVAAGITPRSGTLAEIYGALGAQGLAPPGMLEKVAAQAAALPQRPRYQSPGEENPGMTIVVGGPIWAVALAQFAKTRSLDVKSLEVLQRFADDPDVAPLVQAALAGRGGTAGLQCDRTRCSGLPARAPQDTRARQLDADLAAINLAQQPAGAFRQALSTLRKLRAAEIEPEYRMALGRLIVGAQVQRSAPRAVGQEEF